MRTRASAMVGRDGELHTVERVLEAARAGRGGAVFVVGEGGIGKSRLAAAAADIAFVSGMSMLRGRGSSVGPMVPFRSLTEALMSLLRSGDQPDVSELGPYRPVLARLIPDWGPPPAGEDASSVVLLAEAVLRLVLLAGRERGCLLILDDMQDSDAETLAVVEYLADNLDGQPAVLLGVVRSGVGPAFTLAQSAAQRGSGALVELHRLSLADVHGLAASCLGASPASLPRQVAEQLWVGSQGIPLLVEELLSEMLRDGLIVRDAQGWRVTGPPQAKVSAPLTRAMSGRLSRIGPEGREMLSLAAMLGQRFPLAVLQAATGLGSRQLLSHLHAEPVTQLVAPDRETPDWYAFQHVLLVDVLLALLTPAERGRIAGQAAAAVEAVHPGLPSEWCQVAATLHLLAGDQARAGRLFTKAGRRALAQGAANSAVTLLDRALELLSRPADAQARADAVASLLYALAEVGLVERALTSVGALEQAAGLLSRGERARLHTRLAWAAAVAGRCDDGLAQVAVARSLLHQGADGHDTAAVDVVEAHLVLDLPGPDQVRKAEELARRGATAAQAADLPLVACQAWQLLGALSRSRDPEEATACLERARETAVRHGLLIEEIHALIRLGNDDALRDGSLGRLEQARGEASRAGAVTARFQTEVSLALQAILRADFGTAQELIDQVLESTTRLGLQETTRYALLLRAVLAAHRGRRREMDAALAELHHRHGDLVLYAPRIHGLARAWCALLEENRVRAQADLATALAAEEESPTIFQLTGRYGLDLLLRVLAGTAGWPEYQAITAVPVSQLRWDRQFTLLARAVLAGRDGQAGAAQAAVTEALQVNEPYATARHLGLRLVGEAAIVDGWGTPAGWLRSAEEYFHDRGIPAVAGACRALMRRAGVPVTQRRHGTAGIPDELRAAGITVREFEILQLMVGRLSNREIAARLHLSPRTVEKHVASLIVKTGQRDRVALSEFASTMPGRGQVSEG